MIWSLRIVLVIIRAHVFCSRCILLDGSTDFLLLGSATTDPIALRYSTDNFFFGRIYGFFLTPFGYYTTPPPPPPPPPDLTLAVFRARRVNFFGYYPTSLFPTRNGVKLVSISFPEHYVPVLPVTYWKLIMAYSILIKWRRIETVQSRQSRLSSPRLSSRLISQFNFVVMNSHSSAGLTLNSARRPVRDFVSGSVPVYNIIKDEDSLAWRSDRRSVVNQIRSACPWI